MSETTALYRYYDLEGLLLYVGISKYPVTRLEQHTATCCLWTRKISNINIEWLPSRELALNAELEAIKTEKPVNNVKGIKSYKSNVLKPANASAITKLDSRYAVICLDDRVKWILNIIVSSDRDTRQTIIDILFFFSKYHTYYNDFVAENNLDIGGRRKKTKFPINGEIMSHLKGIEVNNDLVSVVETLFVLYEEFGFKIPI